MKLSVALLIEQKASFFENNHKSSNLREIAGSIDNRLILFSF